MKVKTRVGSTDTFKYFSDITHLFCGHSTCREMLNFLYVSLFLGLLSLLRELHWDFSQKLEI